MYNDSSGLAAASASVWREPGFPETGQRACRQLGAAIYIYQNKDIIFYVGKTTKLLTTAICVMRCCAFVL